MRDQGLLDFVLARAPHRRRYDPDADILGLAASYGFGLANNHPFIDGNKRVAFMAMYIFLGLNEYRLVATESEVVTRMLDVAVGALDEAGLEAWLRSHAQPIQGDFHFRHDETKSSLHFYRSAAGRHPAVLRQ